MFRILHRAQATLRVALCALLLALTFHVTSAVAGTPDEEKATAFVSKLVDEAVNNVIGADLTTAQKEERFRSMFVEAADIPSIAAFVVGREWRRTSKEDKAKFIDLFQDVTVLTWLSHLDEYRGLRINITGAFTDRRDVFVESDIKLTEGKPISIVWRVQKRRGDGLKLIDIAIESNSMLINTRKQYASVMKREGGLPGLTASLEKMRHTLRTAKSE